MRDWQLRLDRLIRRYLRHRHYKTPPADYPTYVRLQMGAQSFESDTPQWADGQRRHLRKIAHEIPRDGLVIDCASGDGCGLTELSALGFSNLLGIELDPAKAACARAEGHEVIEADMHDLSRISDGTVAAVLTSHTLEHAFDPDRVVSEFRRILRPGGYLNVVLPFPDRRDTAHVHVAKFKLGLDDKTGDRRVARFFADRGFAIRSHQRDGYREAEIWISATRL